MSPQPELDATDRPAANPAYDTQPNFDNLQEYRLPLTPVHSQESIASVKDSSQSKSDHGGSGLLRDVASIGSYGLTMLALSKFTPLPTPVRMAVGLVTAGATSDVLKDGSFDGPIADPGTYVRGAGMALAAHGVWQMATGPSSPAWQGSYIEMRELQLRAAGLEPIAQGSTKDAALAYLNPANILGRNQATSEFGSFLFPEDILAMKQNLAASTFYRRLGGALLISTAGQATKFADGSVEFKSIPDVIEKTAASGLLFSALSNMVVFPTHNWKASTIRNVLGYKYVWDYQNDDELIPSVKLPDIGLPFVDRWGDDQGILNPYRNRPSGDQ